jgi:hypothetical protein
MTRGRSAIRPSLPAWVLGLGLVGMLAGGNPALAPVALDHIVLSEDGGAFRHVDAGEPFMPWGFNYDRTNGGLLDEFWADGGAWPIIAADLAEMKALGANVVRIHLQFGAFMDDPESPDEDSLARLERLVGLAESTGLYLVLTGLGSYRAADVPGWYDGMGEADRWAAQARFWDAVAERVGSTPAIFAYDLMNERRWRPANRSRPGCRAPGSAASSSSSTSPAIRPVARATRSCAAGSG